MSGNTGVPIAGAAAASGAFDDDGGERTDNGVPVGEADVEADRERASGEVDGSGDDEPGDDLESTTLDEGVPVGSADAEEDRRRASGDDREGA